MSRYIDVDELSRAKFHPLPYTHITPADIKDAEAYMRGWNDAIDAIIECAPTADVVELEGSKVGKYLSYTTTGIPTADVRENVHASWVKVGQSFLNPNRFRNYACSNCGFDIERKKFNFCPNCGAVMDERSEDGEIHSC